ncbi:MAG: hypothetical protein U5K71_05090 [Gracilimonas sp.]|nr:hypothetical protein [Gracilimonas sp.]
MNLPIWLTMTHTGGIAFRHFMHYGEVYRHRGYRYYISKWLGKLFILSNEDYYDRLSYLTVPAIILILGAFVLPLIPERIRSSAFIVFPLIALGILWSLPDGSLIQLPFASYELHLLTVDGTESHFWNHFCAHHHHWWRVCLPY